MKNPILESPGKTNYRNRIIFKDGELQLSDENLRNYPVSNRLLDEMARQGYIQHHLKR